MRISLCVICGNEIEHILSMLNSFAPIFDELSLVRAIGSKTPDETEQIARDWCAAKGVSFVFTEHKNQLGTEAWDHVDSFAAARNKAFAQATGEWLVWADCDDLIENVEGFREKLELLPAEVLMVRAYYDVRGSGKRLYRERAIRSHAFHDRRIWHHEVHENLLLLPNDKHEDWQAPVWIHAPAIVKRENRRRNLRILAHSVREVAAQYFYIHQEHYCSTNAAAAISFGKIAISFPNLQPAFRYETMINLAKLCNSHGDALTYLMQAHAIYPWCREAIAHLILLYFEKNDTVRSTYWAEKMLELREPLEADRPWTHEVKWYTWAGYDLAARAFRAHGNLARATVLQAQYHCGKTPRISLLHATLNRSSQAVACRDAWLSSASNASQIEHIFAVESDDKDSKLMADHFVSVVSDKKSCVSAWNRAAKKATGNIFVQLSDDWVPSLGWDDKLLAEVKDKDPAFDSFVIAVNDGNRTDTLLCMAICSRARYEQQGKELFHEGYESVFSDNEFSARAWKNGVVIDARDRITFEHLHPVFGRAPNDKTYDHNNSPERYKAGRELFELRNPS